MDSQKTYFKYPRKKKLDGRSDNYIKMVWNSALGAKEQHVPIFLHNICKVGQLENFIERIWLNNYLHFDDFQVLNIMCATQ